MSPTSSAAASRAATAVALRQAEPTSPSAVSSTGTTVAAVEDGEEEVLEYVEEETMHWLMTALKSTLARVYSGLVTNLYRKVEAVNLRLILGEEGELGSPTFDRLAAVLDEVVALLKRHHCFPTVRHHIIGCLLGFVNASLFNLVLHNKDFCSLEHAIRLKMITKMLREWCGEAEGKPLQVVADEKFVHIQQLGLVLMSDKDMFGDPDMVSVLCPMLSLAQIEQLLINWNLNDQNMEPVSQEVLCELKTRNVEVRIRLCFFLPLPLQLCLYLSLLCFPLPHTTHTHTRTVHPEGGRRRNGGSWRCRCCRSAQHARTRSVRVTGLAHGDT